MMLKLKHIPKLTVQNFRTLQQDQFLMPWAVVSRAHVSANTCIVASCEHLNNQNESHDLIQDTCIT